MLDLSVVDWREAGDIKVKPRYRIKPLGANVFELVDQLLKKRVMVCYGLPRMLDLLDGKPVKMRPGDCHPITGDILLYYPLQTYAKCGRVTVSWDQYRVARKFGWKYFRSNLESDEVVVVERT